jgi:hypothetical protein
MHSRWRSVGPSTVSPVPPPPQITAPSPYGTAWLPGTSCCPRRPARYCKTTATCRRRCPTVTAAGCRRRLALFPPSPPPVVEFPLSPPPPVVIVIWPFPTVTTAGRCRRPTVTTSRHRHRHPLASSFDPQTVLSRRCMPALQLSLTNSHLSD